MTIKSDVTTIHPVLPERLPDFQLLDLPAVRDALGLLQASRGADRLRTRRHGRLYMGQESLAFRSVHDLRLRHPLGTSRPTRRRTRRNQCSQFRAGDLGYSSD